MTVHPNDSAILAGCGLNMQAVFDLQGLPAAIRQAIEAVESVAGYRQLLLFGHGGPRMWLALAASPSRGLEHPVDSFSAEVVARYFAEENPDKRHVLLFPGERGSPLPLQQLGRLAGWHHASPFRVGVNARWGPWFAYRAVVLADTEFAPTLPMQEPSPCEACVAKPCLSACPAVSPTAAENGDIPLEGCMDVRLRQDSPCARTCLSRSACPVQSGQRYSDEQMAYHYGRSLDTIRRYRDAGVR